MESKQRKLAALRSLANSPDVSSRSGTGPRPPVAPKPVMRSRLGGTGAQANPGTSMVRRLRQNFSPPPPHANQRYQVSRVLNQNVELPCSPLEMIACIRVEGCNHQWGSIIGVSHAIIIGWNSPKKLHENVHSDTRWTCFFYYFMVVAEWSLLRII